LRPYSKTLEGRIVLVVAAIKAFDNKKEWQPLFLSHEATESRQNALAALRSKVERKDSFPHLPLYFLKQDIMEDMTRWTPTSGIPQGAVVSPLLANPYLHELDVEMRQAGLVMVRYADDAVVLSAGA